MQWFRHAFAVEPEGPAEPTRRQRAIVDLVCREVVRRKMATPVLIALETCRPLNYLGAQAMHFFAPVATVLLNAQGYRRFAEFLERRGSIDYMCRKIEALESGMNTPPDEEEEGDEGSGE